MKPVLIIISFYIISFAGGVGDFAPSKVGSQWTYLYFSLLSEGGGVEKTIDSQNITIKICQYVTSGTDSILQLQISQTGIQKNAFMSEEAKINMVSETYFDSVMIKGDTLFRRGYDNSNNYPLFNSYRCPIFPFWKSHIIESDNVKLESFKGQDLHTFYYRSEGFYHQYSVYIQNIGLLKDTLYWSRGSLFGCSSVHLLSFESAESSALQSIPTMNHPRSYVNNVTLLVKTTKLNGTKLFSLDGKMANHNKRYVPGFYILERNDNIH